MHRAWRAALGVTMGGAVTNVAMETANVAIAADGLRKLLLIVAVSRASRRFIRRKL